MQTPLVEDNTTFPKRHEVLPQSPKLHHKQSDPKLHRKHTCPGLHRKAPGYTRSQSCPVFSKLHGKLPKVQRCTTELLKAAPQSCFKLHRKVT
jgi:hypothetical protein